MFLWILLTLSFLKLQYRNNPVVESNLWLLQYMTITQWYHDNKRGFNVISTFYSAFLNLSFNLLTVKQIMTLKTTSEVKQKPTLIDDDWLIIYTQSQIRLVDLK